MGAVSDSELARLFADAQAADRGAAPASIIAGNDGAGLHAGGIAIPGGGVPAAELRQDREAWGKAVVQAGDFIRKLHPVARANWTDDQLSALGHAIADVAQHYGMTMGEAARHPLLLLLAASVPLAWPFAEPHILKAIESAKPKEGEA